MEKIHTLISKESKIISSIESNNNNKIRVKELEETKISFENDIKKLLEDKNLIEKQKLEYYEKCIEIKNNYDLIFSGINKSIETLNDKSLNIESEALKITNRISSIKNNKESLSYLITNSSSKIGSIKQEIESIKSNQDKFNKISCKINEEDAVIGRLIALEVIFGLEGIQTRIIGNYLPLLNKFIKRFMDVLSNGEMMVEIYINKKSKVDIGIKGGSAGIYYLLSGGEKMLVRLAVSIGLSMLSFTRCAQKSEVIFLDEIFGCFDESHINSVFKLLAELQSEFNRVVVISHNSVVNSLIKNQILIEKQPGNSGYSLIKKIV